MVKTRQITSVLAVAAVASAQNTATSARDVYAAQATAPTSHETSDVCGHAFDRFVTIWLENTDYDKAAADPNLQWLAKHGITLENYFGVTHPSEPNYVASVAGDYFGIDGDGFNAIDKNISSVVDLLEDKGVSWSTAQMDMPYSGFEGFSWVNHTTKANDYVRKHNPTIMLDANLTPDRLAKQKNLTEFHKDIEADTLAQWVFLTPSMIADGHDSGVTVAGQWTRDFLEPLLNDTTSNFWKRSLVLVTFDETHTYTEGNRVFSILLGDAIPHELVGTTDSNYYDHYSEIATVEANWDLHTLGRFDVGANVFDFVGKLTGDTIRSNDVVTGSDETVYLNSSTPGPFSSDDASPYWPPNICAKSQTGRTVLPSIQETWKDATQTIYTSDIAAFDGDHPPPVVKIEC